MGRLIVVTGPPGAGKTTVAGHLVAALDSAVLVAGDDHFAALGDSLIPPWLPEAEEQNATVLESAAAAAGRLATSGDVVFEGVVGPWFLSRFLVATGQRQIDYAVLMPPEDVCRARVATRTGHGFTDDDATRQMYADFRSAPSDRRFWIQDAELSPQAVAARILGLVESRSLVRRSGSDSR